MNHDGAYNTYQVTTVPVIRVMMVLKQIRIQAASTLSHTWYVRMGSASKVRQGGNPCLYTAAPLLSAAAAYLVFRHNARCDTLEPLVCIPLLVLN